MYCIQCGVKLAETEEKCPLCSTPIQQPTLPPLYPAHKLPPARSGRAAVCGALLIVFLIPLALTFFSDWQANGALDWFGYAAGGIVLTYLVAALPLWFRRPNPIVFVPCDFAAAAVYLLYIDLATGGGWFLPFALPVLGGVCCITCTVVTLTRCTKGGRLYLYGGASMAAGGLLLLTEFLLHVTFTIPLVGWSVYPFAVLFLLGSLLIYVGISPAARETLARKLFF